MPVRDPGRYRFCTLAVHCQVEGPALSGVQGLRREWGGRHLLGLWLAPTSCGGQMQLVAMELCGMVWIELVNSDIEGLGGRLLCRRVLRSR